MGKAAPDAVIDAMLSEIAEADTLYVCSDEPANFAGIAAVALAEVALTPGNGNGDFTIANGDVSGRKITVTQQPDLEIDASGEADHVVLADAVGEILKYVTTCTPQVLTSGGTVTVPSFKIEVEDPT